MDDSESFSVELESDPDDLLVVRLDGELDFAEADWVEDTLAAAAPHHRRIEVDLHGVSFLDSAGVRALVTLKQRADVIGLAFRFTDPSDEVCRTLAAAGVEDLVEASPPALDEPA